MVENALYNALDQYNKKESDGNSYDKNWGSVFNFIGKYQHKYEAHCFADFDDTRLLTEYTKIAL